MIWGGFSMYYKVYEKIAKNAKNHMKIWIYQKILLYLKCEIKLIKIWKIIIVK